MWTRSSSCAELALLAALTGCQPAAPATELALASPATTLPSPAPGPDIFITPTEILLSDVAMRAALADSLSDQPEDAPRTTHAVTLRAGALPDDTNLLIPALLPGLQGQREAIRQLEQLLIDEEHLPLTPRVHIHPDTPNATLLRVLYTLGQAELVDPQLLLAAPDGPRALRIDTPRMRSPAASSGAPGELLDALGARDGDMPCEALTIYLGADGVQLRTEASTEGDALALKQADPAAPLTAPPGLRDTSTAGVLARLPAARCAAVTFGALPTLPWRAVAPALQAARQAAPAGPLYLVIGRP
jgi:hypothetical protein